MKCPICGKKFKNPVSYYIHLKREHFGDIPT